MKLELKTTPPAGWISLFVGSAALPLIAALWGSIDPAFRLLLPVALQRWYSTLQGPLATDVMLGSAGALLAAAEIESYAPNLIRRSFLKLLQELSESHLRNLLTKARREPVYLGFAHGITGQLFALEAARASFGLKFSVSLRDSVLDLVSRSRIDGPNQSAMWPNFTSETVIGIHGWCHGAPGIGLALIGSYAFSGDDSYRQCVVRALNGTHRYHTGPAFFCCGAAGRSQVLIEAYRLTGNSEWLRLAHGVSRQLPRTFSVYAHVRGFHRGRLGLNYLRWRLRYPVELPLMGMGALSAAKPREGHVAKKFRGVKPNSGGIDKVRI